MSESPADPTDRGLAAFRRLVVTTFPNIRFSSPWEYRVVATHSDNTCDLTPADTTWGMPDLKSVATRSGVPGGTMTPALGSLCVVTFVNMDPTRPRITDGFDSTNAQAVVLQAGTVGAARGGLTQVPATPAGPPWGPGMIVAPTGDRVIIAFTALDSSGGVLTGIQAIGATLWDGLSSTEKAYYPPTPAGFALAQTASAAATPSPGLGVGAIYGFVASGSSTVRIG